MSNKKELDVVFYNLKEVENLLGVTNRTLLNYIYKEKLKANKIGGKWTVTKDALEAFIKGE